MTHDKPGEFSEAMLVCIQNCQDCYRACLQTWTYCSHMGGRHAKPAHLRLLLDCADICQTSANFMIRQSPLHAHTCAACAVVCEQCAQDCDSMSADTRMKACADTCRHCAESCSAMAGDAGAAGAGAEAAAAAAAAGGRASRGPRRQGAVLTRRKTR